MHSKETEAEGVAHPRSSSFLPFEGFPMVKLANPGDLRPDPQHCKAAGPLPVKVEIEDPLEDEHGPLDKRSRISPPFQQQWGSGTRMGRQVVPQDLLEEPSPLGLRLRKSPSLVDLIQMRLSQADSAATSCITSCENSEAGKDKSTALSGAADKMKASNFPITLLRIGTWERVSKYEGDLVAKCYFAKHKLVWEVLEGGLKSKIEIQWSDITSLKATCPENGPGTLDIVLGRQPLFFRETNPQPRKHTLWQATSDFTGGQASIHRRHFLQCAQGLLSKHFEKLIQCDPHLNMLSQQAEIILESQYFEPRCSVFEDQEESKFHGFDKLKDTCGSPISGFGDHGSPCAAPSISTKSEPKDPVGRTPDCVPRQIPSISVIDTQVIGENAGHETEAPKGLTCGNQFKVPGLRASMSMCDLVNHIEHCISGQPTSDNPFLSADGLPNRDMLEELNRYLLSDTQIASTSDEQSLMSRVNSLCCLLQKDAATAPNLHTDCGDSTAVHRGVDNKPRPLLLGPALERKPLFDLSAVEEESDDDTAYKQPPPGISRKESFGELLMYLPRIASLPQVLFNK